MTAYNISNYTELKTMKDDRAGDYTLTNDIDASASETENASGGVYQGFEPVGLVATRFTGMFDGDGYKIKNLYINRTTIDYVGFLGYVDRDTAGGFIKDVTIENADITGRSNVGVLAGYIYADGSGVMAVTNVAVSGTVKANRSVAGGFVGTTTTSATVSFTNCSSSVAVSKKGTTTETGTVSVGGFIGNSGASSIVYNGCLASGSVTWTQTATQDDDYKIGGFIGSGSTGGDFDNCTATGDVTLDVVTTGTVYVGGFVGSEGSNSADYSECFAYGDVTNSTTTAGAHIGGFVGHTYADTAKCGAEGNVENYCTHATTNKTGGFCGVLQTDTISNCYAKGTVNVTSGIGHANAYIGGFIGYLSSTTTEYCYSVGEVYSTDAPTNGGGFSGGGTSTTYTDCFYDKQTSGWVSSDGGTAKNTTQMKTQTTFTNWDFDDIWELSTYTRTPGLGTTIWLSEVGDYEDFEEGLGDADSFSVTLPTTNKIMWIEALESLIAGTGGDEWKIASNDFGTPITPTAHTVRQQTDYGSKTMQALKVNESILFVDFVGRKIRELTYSEEFGKHVAPDLTSLAEHITDSGVTSVALQKNPDIIVWCTLDDGSLLSMTYERDQNVVAWSKHPLGTDVEAQSVCVIPGSTEDEVWLTMKRTMSGVNSGVFVIYVERMASRVFTDIDDCFFVDSGRTIEHSSAATTTIAGLPHLEGETVALLGDGVDLDTYTVSSGVITASTAVTTAQVGLAYTYKLEPMKPVVETRMGTTAASIVSAHEMGISLLDSAGVKVGVSDTDLYDIDLDNVRWTNLSSITDLFTGTVMTTVDGGYSIERPLIISSSAPLPCTVRALIPKMEMAGR